MNQFEKEEVTKNIEQINFKLDWFSKCDCGYWDWTACYIKEDGENELCDPESLKAI